MGRLIVITAPDLATGFELAGVETFAAQSPQEAETMLRRLLESEEASLIAVRQDLLQAMDRQLQRRVEVSYRPVVMAIPGGTSATSGEGRHRYIAELIRRAIGFHITFEADRRQTSSS